MRNFIVAILMMTCFGIAKAHFLPKNFKTLKPQIDIRSINALQDYSVTFKFFPKQKYIYGPAPKAIAFQNKLVIENSCMAITKTTIRNLKYSQKSIKE